MGNVGLIREFVDGEFERLLSKIHEYEENQGFEKRDFLVIICRV